MMKHILLIVCTLLTPITASSEIVLDSEQKLFIEGLNEERRKFAIEQTKSDMHELEWASKLQNFANSQNYTEVLAAEKPKYRFTMTTNYQDGAAELEERRRNWTSDVAMIDRPREHLIALPTRIACVKRDKLVKNFKVLCWLMPINRKALWTLGTAGPPGSNCAKGYHNNRGLCSRIQAPTTAKAQAELPKTPEVPTTSEAPEIIIPKNEPSTTKPTPPPEKASMQTQPTSSDSSTSSDGKPDKLQATFIARVNTERRKFAKHNNVSNMYELKWDQGLQEKLDQWDFKQNWSRQDFYNSYLTDYNIKIGFTITSFSVPKDTLLYPLQTTIACAFTKQFSDGVKIVCFLGPVIYSRKLTFGTPGSNCSNRYENNDGLCSVKTTVVIDSTQTTQPLLESSTNPETSTTRSSKSEATLDLDHEQAKFIKELNEQRRMFAIKNNSANMHELTWSKKLAAIDGSIVENRSLMFEFRTYDGMINYTKTAINGNDQMMIKRVLNVLNPLQTDIACGNYLNNQRLLCIFGPFKEWQELVEGTPGTNCSKGFENRNNLCSRIAPVPSEVSTTSSTSSPTQQTEYQLPQFTLRIPTLPAELRDYDEKDGDEYDEDFPTDGPMRRSRQKMEGVFLIFVLVFMVLNV